MLCTYCNQGWLLHSNDFTIIWIWKKVASSEFFAKNLFIVWNRLFHRGICNYVGLTFWISAKNMHTKKAFYVKTCRKRCMFFSRSSARNPYYSTVACNFWKKHAPFRACFLAIFVDGRFNVKTLLKTLQISTFLIILH